MKPFHHAIVIGASSGIGAEIVKQLAASGTRVAAVARRLDRLQALADGNSSIIPFEHDVTHFDEVPELFQRITADLGGLDLIVYAAGVMPPVGSDEFCFPKDKAMVDVNLLGAMAWLNQAAVRFTNTRHGSIVGIGSVAGDRGRAGQPAYNATKAAFTTYLEALRNRLSTQGVIVVTIKPGPTETEMTAHLESAKMSAADVARFVIAKARTNGEHYVKITHRVAFAIIRGIPSPLFRRLKL